MEQTIHSFGDKESVVEFLEQYMDFETHADDDSFVYQLVLIARERENEEVTYNSEIVFNEIVTDREHIRRKVEKLWALGENYVAPDYGMNPHFRLYFTVNSRDVQTAMFNFQQEITHYNNEIHNGHTEMVEKLERLDSLWKHLLQTDEARTGKRFMIDVDETDMNIVSELIEQFSEVTTIYAVIKTPNGYHFITDNFAYPLHDFYGEYDVDVKTDSLAFLTMI